MRAHQVFIFTIAAAIVNFWGKGPIKEETSTALVPQISPNLLNTNPPNTNPPNIPPCIRLLLATRAKRPRRLPCFPIPPTVEASATAETPQPSSAEAASRLWDQAVHPLNKFCSATRDKTAAAAVTGSNVRKNMESTRRDHSICRRRRPFLKSSKLPKLTFWNYATPAGKPATSRCYGRYIEEHFKKITDWSTREEEIPLFLKKKIKSQRSVRKSATSYSGYSEDCKKAIGCFTEGNESPVSLKEREKIEIYESKSTISSSGNNEDESKKIRGLLKKEQESPIFLKEKNKEDSNIRQITICDSEESLQPRLVKQHQPQQGVKNLQHVKKRATNQNMIQHGNVTTDRPTERPGVVSRKSAQPRSTAVPVGSKQKGSSLAVTRSAGVKKGVSSDISKNMKLAVTKLESKEWDTVMGGMEDISQILRCNPALVEEHLTVIYRHLSSAVLHLRSKVVPAACKMAQDIFKTVQCTTKTGYHDLVTSLLQVTAHDKKFVRQEAAEALDSMVLNTPPDYTVKAVVSYGLRHKSPLVRATASRLLTMVITTSGADAVLGPTASRLFKHEVISSAASFLEDRNIDARLHAQELFKFLMTEYEDCESEISKEIEEKLLKRIQKKIDSMRAEINKRSHHSSRK